MVAIAATRIDHLLLNFIKAELQMCIAYTMFIYLYIIDRYSERLAGVHPV